MATDRTQAEITVGDPVLVSCIVTSIGGTAQAPVLTLTPKYKNFAGAQPTISVDAIQVQKED